jgi:hypothetical protein
MALSPRRRAYLSAAMIIGAWAIVALGQPTLPVTVLALLLTSAAVLAAPG